MFVSYSPAMLRRLAALLVAPLALDVCADDLGELATPGVGLIRRPRRAVAVPLAALLAVALAAPGALAAQVSPNSSNMVEGPPPIASQPPLAPAVQPQPFAPAPPNPSVASQAAGAPVGPAAEPPPPAPLRPRRGLMIGGWTALGAVYLVTAGITAIGLGLRSYNPYPEPCGEPLSPCLSNKAPERIKMMYIPVIGPFIALTGADTLKRRALLVWPGVLQVAALTVGIIGTVQFVRDRRAVRSADVDGLKLGKRLRLGVAPTRFLDGGSVTLAGRF